MAESVDALVSNTSGATRAGSTPALGTESEFLHKDSDFLFLPYNIGYEKIIVSLHSVWLYN